jgi:5-hydroxyisourate hydrolase-like protein (transthyretin family)
MNCSSRSQGTTTHVLVDGNGSPVALTSTAANGDERSASSTIARQSTHQDGKHNRTPWEDADF